MFLVMSEYLWTDLVINLQLLCQIRCLCFKTVGYYDNNLINPVSTLIIVDITSFFDSCFDSFFNSSSVNPSMYFFISLYELAKENIDLRSDE